ncbi:CCA tRNA nucleotidyltransferase [Candidatus Peribacteria bacterium]|jgi:putative nucleotidyltransferase with HDIG domain|nr:CCA tRNA nucleotidyltransferase [Candidatus Peribacteria bacterium]MBT4020788.1 CCA tRNA nucleotidyltransferase [Candidatus Peribacteria bacterium]MBT4241068.1 CCA tRNA nucleotidyltransferase [Candidatus Peribacteria bacterium]MBT4474433.1 CCA tRNA nucleotidyltransferase [Candidatus Peribacteria bacterium]
MPLSQEIIDRTLATPQGTAAYHIVEKLTDEGHEAWWVGGCVRDMLIDEIPEDIDIATSALPDEIKKLFEKHDAASESYGSILVASGGDVFELTTFREDSAASDGRHPENVIFTKEKEKDAARRDVTINALYYHPISGELFDPFEGEKDLNERLIRIIGDAEKRIEEDNLRLLRVIRFKAYIEGQYHPDTFKALHKKSKSIEKLSGTRRFKEIEKILLGPHPEIALEDLWETDILEYLLPEVHACKGVAQPAHLHPEGDVWNHVMRILSSFTEDHEKDVRWAALFHDTGKPKTFSIDADRIHFNDHASVGADVTKEALDRLQFTSSRRDKIAWLVKHHMMMAAFSEMDDKRKAHWYYHPWFLELLQLFWLDMIGTQDYKTDLYDKIIEDYNKFLDAHPRPKKPLISGDEIMDLMDIEPGEKVGEILEMLHEKQIKKEITSKKEAMEFIKQL